MKLLVLLLILHLSVAANKKASYSNGRSQALIESFNKDYFKYLKLYYAYHNRTQFDTKIEFDLLKTLHVENIWLEMSFYHKRNNQYHLLPIGRGVQAKKFFEENPFGIGDSIQKVCSFPMKPGKRIITIPKYTHDDSNTFQVPMVGEYKIAAGVKVGAVPIFTVVWMGAISN